MLLSFLSPWRPSREHRRYLVLQITGIPNLQSASKAPRRAVEAGTGCGLLCQLKDVSGMV